MLYPIDPAAARLRLRLAALRARTAVTWWLLSLSVTVRSLPHRGSRGATPWRARLAPRPDEWHRPGTFTTYEWSRATVAEVHVRATSVTVELHLDGGTVTRATAGGVWSARAPRLTVLRVLPLSEATFHSAERLLALSRDTAAVRYRRLEQRGPRRSPLPVITESLQAASGATIPLRTALTRG